MKTFLQVSLVCICLKNCKAFLCSGLHMLKTWKFSLFTCFNRPFHSSRMRPGEVIYIAHCMNIILVAWETWSPIFPSFLPRVAQRIPSFLRRDWVGTWCSVRSLGPRQRRTLSCPDPPSECTWSDHFDQSSWLAWLLAEQSCRTCPQEWPRCCLAWGYPPENGISF